MAFFAQVQSTRAVDYDLYNKYRYEMYTIIFTVTKTYYIFNPTFETFV